MRKQVGRGILHTLLVLVAAWTLFPLVWFLMLAVKPAHLESASPPAFTFTPVFDAFRATFLPPGGYFGQYLLNSIVIATTAMTLSIVVATPAAYAFSRFRFAGRRPLLFWLLSTRMAPPFAVALPMFMLMAKLRLIDTHAAPIMAHLTFNIPFAVWLMKGFFDGIPNELDEAVFVDGGSRFTAFTRVVLPASLPGLAATAIFAFVFSWNEFMLSLILTQDAAKTMPVAITGFWTERMIGWSRIAATSSVHLIPALLVALFMRKYLIRGLTLGAIK